MNSRWGANGWEGRKGCVAAVEACDFRGLISLVRCAALVKSAGTADEASVRKVEHLPHARTLTGFYVRIRGRSTHKEIVQNLNYRR